MQPGPTFSVPVVLLAAACSSPAPIASPPPSVEDATVVYDSAMLADLPDLPASRAWQTGSDSTATSIEFQRITSLAVSESDAIYVLDFGGGVRVFDWGGVLVNTFAPMGPSPAELKNPRSIAVGHDTVFILDNQLKLFSASGEYLDQITSDAGEFVRTLRIEHTDSGLAMQRRNVNTRALRAAGEFHDTLFVFLKDVGHGLRQTFPTQSYHMLTYPVGSSSLSGPIPLLDRVRATVTRDARLYAPDQEHFIIEVRSARGNVLERIVGQPPRVPTTDDDIRDLVALLQAGGNYDEDRAPRYLQEYRKVPRAKFRPALGDLLVSAGGHVVVERRDLGQIPYNHYDARSKRVWLVIDPQWEPLGYVTLPGRFRPMEYTGCSLVGYETDDYNTHLLARYDIGASLAGLCPADEVRDLN